LGDEPPFEGALEKRLAEALGAFQAGANGAFDGVSDRKPAFQFGQAVFEVLLGQRGQHPTQNWDADVLTG